MDERLWRSVFTLLVFVALGLALYAALTPALTPAPEPDTFSVQGAGSVTIGGKLLVSSTAVTLTAGMVITPAYSFYDLSASGSVSMTLGVCTSRGQSVTLYGNDNQTITVNDTNLLSTDGNAVTLGQYDVVVLTCDGSKWAHVSKSANS